MFFKQNISDDRVVALAQELNSIRGIRSPTVITKSDEEKTEEEIEEEIRADPDITDKTNQFKDTSNVTMTDLGYGVSETYT